MALNVSKCTSCNRLTPSKHGECMYCGTPLPGGGAKAMHEEPRSLGQRNARFKPQADDRAHYLLTDTGEPVPLAPGKLFVLGRDARSSLVLRGGDASRQHAEIDWQGDPPRPLLCEVRSRNGTFLNDRLVQRDAPQPLRNGDRVRLGSLTLLYLHVAERELKRELQERSLEETRELRAAAGAPAAGAPAPAGAPAEVFAGDATRPTGGPPPGRPREGDGSLDLLVAAALGDEGGVPAEGDLGQTPGSELVRRIHERRLAGVLSVDDGLEQGEAVFADGQCQDARMGGQTGRGALAQLVRMRRGRFWFRAGATALAERDAVPLEGNLSTTSARDLVRALLQGKRTGVLTVFDGSDTGEVTIEDGVCEHAAFGPHVGREALNAIIRLQQGAYRFRADDEPPAAPAPGAEPEEAVEEEDAVLGEAMAALDWERIPEPPPPSPPPPPRRRLDPWEVDPDDTLMPSPLDDLPLAPAASALREPAAPPARRAQPPTVREPALREPPRAPALREPPPRDAGDDRVQPLRQGRPAPDAHSRAPLRNPSREPGGPLRPEPPRVDPSRADPSRSGTSSRRVPPPLPPRPESGRAPRSGG